jgi:transcription termination factor Rho
MTPNELLTMEPTPGTGTAPKKKTRRSAKPAEAPTTEDAVAETPTRGRSRRKVAAETAVETSPSDASATPSASTPQVETPHDAAADGEAPKKRKRVRRKKAAPDAQATAPVAAASGDPGVTGDRPTTPVASPTPTAEPLPVATEHASDSLAANGSGEPGSGKRKRRRRRRRRGKGSGVPGEGGAIAQPTGAPPAPPEPTEIEVQEGIVDLEGGEARLRHFSNGFVSSPQDPSITRSIVDRTRLRQCQRIVARTGLVRGHHRRQVLEVLEVEGHSVEAYLDRRTYAELTPLDPQPRMCLEFRGCPPANRLIDLFCPIGFGTRGLIVAPPKAGKTILLKDIAAGIKHNHPHVELVALLIDERPEEVTDFRRNVPATVLASSNDQDLETHITLGIAAIERAKRLVEAGRDVVVLLDSLTRLGRAFNNSRRFGSGGRTMSGGLDSRALEVPKQLFGAARKAEEGGSLTIIASCLVDTGSRADQIIFEEFKGTGNMELILDRSISEKRVFPAINLAASGTRKEHLLLSERELKTITALRRRLLSLPPAVQIEQLLAALKRFETNEKLVAG